MKSQTDAVRPVLEALWCLKGTNHTQAFRLLEALLRRLRLFTLLRC